MLLYEDILTGDEMFSDAFPVKVVDDIVYEVECAMITIKEGDVDIGANPSQEEQEEALEEGAQQVNNVVPLLPAPEYYVRQKVLLDLPQAVKAKLAETNPDRVGAFETGAQGFAKKVVANFKDYEFYIGENMNPEGMVALLNYREDGITPYFTFWKDGLKEIKL
ncbi:TCTP domain-containing protein [Mycena venus]|uniref:Translationally-controlled tumor protein homolog n=1 Tax=Mycena venus TaxID=2733690 RepID=A0A8H6Y5F9_9AGAR|nr:TCTP domain-containing protein [Mycena venus]